jgi:ribosomal protein S18 acetylase RimI-like enzyme
LPDQHDGIQILKASPDFAPAAGRLLYLSMRPLADYWMGVDDARVAECILRTMFASEGNLFSYQHAETASVSGEPAGLQVSYPGSTMKQLEFRTLLRFIAAAGLPSAIRMVWRSFPLQSIAEAAPDEYFLAHLAVLPEFEGRGLGRRLLERSMENARRGGFRKLTLTVDADNSRALGLYTRSGFVITASSNLEALRCRFSYHGYHHMAMAL